MNDTATTPVKTRKPHVGSDATKGARVGWWQVGFYAFAIAMSLAMIGVSLTYVAAGRFSGIFTALAVLVTGLSWGLLRAKVETETESVGVEVGTADPALCDFVRDVAEQVGAPMPDSIRLVTEAEFGIVESTRYFGRRVEQSTLTIGLPYLAALNRREFAALLAYEFAQFADLGIDEGVRARRSLRAARDLVAKERKSFINGVYGSYARKMFRSVGGVGVAQEAAAERLAVTLYGTAALRSALRKCDEIAVAFDQLLREYVVPALQRHLHPQDMFCGFAELMQSPSREEERARKLEKRRAAERSPFELNLTASERLARLDEWPHDDGRVLVDRPTAKAESLLEPQAKSSEIVVATWASRLMTCRTEPRTWQQLADQVYSVKTQSLASMVFDDEVDAAGQLEQALAWSADDDWAAVDGTMQASLKSIPDPTERRSKWARCVVVEAAAATGAFSWRHSWDGPPVLIDRSGRQLDAVTIGCLIADGKSSQARSTFAAATSS